MQAYKLDFIRDQDLFEHVKDTVCKYRFNINLSDFNQNIIDPIKLTFDTKIYNKTIADLIDSEIVRQIDKSNNNHIGYFHQNIFNYIGNGWVVPKKRFDIINEDQKIFVEMKNKHNTMNSSSSQHTYMRMQDQIIKDPESICMLVEVVAKKSQNIVWKTRLKGVQFFNEKIRRVSIDEFYKIVTGNKCAFKQLCEVLPTVISDVIQTIGLRGIESTVLKELKNISNNLLNSIYLFSFKKYEGFDNFNVVE